jgi:hypothetical protein
MQGKGSLAIWSDLAPEIWSDLAPEDVDQKSGGDPLPSWLILLADRI